MIGPIGPRSSRRGRCGRSTKSGTACVLPPAVGAPACLWHLTDEERAAYDAYREEADREFAVVFGGAWPGGDQPPACWSWPVPGDLAAQADAALAGFSAGVMARAGDALRAGEMLRIWQAGRCAVCGGQGVDLVEDHDHGTWLVRGLLCRGCNVMEGVDTEPSGCFADYRRRHPTVILGLRLEYAGPLFGREDPLLPDP